jgi:preprotein translocase subunit SecG
MVAVVVVGEGGLVCTKRSAMVVVGKGLVLHQKISHGGGGGGGGRGGGGGGLVFAPLRKGASSALCRTSKWSTP